MTAGRAEFLRALFQKLDASGISWCCLRNHRELFEDSRSDVDLMILPEDIPLFEIFLEETCRETGTRMAQEASYLNFSRTYLTPAGHWVRVDYETEIRWRVFPVLSARSVLLRRVRTDGIWIASPADEAVVIWLAALFRSSLSDRYRARLIQLDEGMRKFPVAASRVYQEAFGRFGRHLWMRQQEIARSGNTGDCWGDLKLALIFRLFSGPTLMTQFFSYFGYDLRRVFRRLLKPRGVYLSVESALWTRADSLELLWKLDRVFPISKSLLLPQGSSGRSWPQKTKIIKTLFKGGLVLRPPCGDGSSSMPRQARRFLVRSTDGDGWIGATVAEGWMSRHVRDQDPVQSCYHAVTEALTFPSHDPREGHPLFCVVLGLDGSGKTTLARSLAQRIFRSNHPCAFRYFHFLPGSAGESEFPWPNLGAAPKKRAAASRPTDALLSVARLLRNVARAWGSMTLSRREFRGILLGDRYLYNYLLDPASVRYFGPPGLAEWALRWAPQPDLIFVLETPPELIFQRKQELSMEEIRTQTETLQNLPLAARKVVRLDGARSPQDLAEQCLQEIEAASGGR